MRADARVRVQEPLQIYLGCRSKSKKCDKQLTHIVRVSACCSIDHGLFFEAELSPWILFCKQDREFFNVLELLPFAKTKYKWSSLIKIIVGL